MVLCFIQAQQHKKQPEVAPLLPLTCALLVYSSCLSLSFSSPSVYLWMARAKSPSLKAALPFSFRAAEQQNALRTAIPL